MSSGHIRFSTSILKRLGEELNPNIDQGILELVKNSYDADAINCIVRIHEPSRGNSSISVVDDGDGMTADEIVNGWLVLGSSSKVTSVVTKLGRTPAGNKGLGRLAALRMGSIATLSTNPRDSTERHTALIDWSKFDRAAMVDEVAIEVRTDRAPKGFSGTSVVVSNLRKSIGRMEVKRLARAMILLADPFVDQVNAFKPVLDAPDFKDLAKLVAESYFSESQFHLVARLTDGRADVRVLDWRGEILYSASHEDVTPSKDKSLYEAPDAIFELWEFNLGSAGFVTRSVTLGELREWLSVVGGVHVYSNGLRVAPYGNAGNDWLDMNLARVRNPEMRPSTNNSLGRVVVNDTSGRLTQKTDRGGFIEDESFYALRKFAMDSLDWMAKQRLASAEARRQQTRKNTEDTSKSSKTSVQQQIERVADPESKSKLSTAFAAYDRARERETNALRKEVQLYRTLSTAGITAATFAHESTGNSLKIIEGNVDTIEFRGLRDLGANFAVTLKGPIGGIRKATASLGVLARATLRLLEQDKRRVGSVDLNKTLNSVLETFEPFFAGRSVSVDVRTDPGNPTVWGTEAAVESIITNFLNNSLTALEDNTANNRALRIESVIGEGVWTLRIADNGPGIRDISLTDIWLPGQTRRTEGTGLGLTIVKDAVTDLGGRVSAVERSDLGGAMFTVTVPTLTK